MTPAYHGTLGGVTHARGHKKAAPRIAVHVYVYTRHGAWGSTSRRTKCDPVARWVGLFTVGLWVPWHNRALRDTKWHSLTLIPCGETLPFLVQRVAMSRAN